MPTHAEQLALAIVQKLQAAGHTAYFAGGCVRDHLMNRPPKDFDVATSATPEQVTALYPRGQQVGAAFGVILVREKKGGETAQVEIATFRSDGQYSDGRHPDTVHFTTAEHDAQRRDFTCNGLFLDPVTDTLHDFVGGQADIASKTLRAIGDPNARFNEDHLRMLRAIRFAARFDFTIDPATRAAIESHASQIQTISRERIGEEMRSILEHPTRAAAVRLLADTGLLEKIWPLETWPAAHSGRTLDGSRPPRVASLPLAMTDRVTVLAAVHRDAWATSPTPPPYSNWTKTAAQLQYAFALANDERDEFLFLGENLPTLLNRALWTRPRFKRLLAHRHKHWIFALHSLAFAERMGKSDPDLDAWEQSLREDPGGIAPAPHITGETLIRLGAAPGPQFKLWLEQLYDRQLNLEFPTPDAARAAAKELIAHG